MKRIHLFEFEDFEWFPNWLRICMTRYIMAFHKMLGTSNQLASLVARGLTETGKTNIIDLCSGSGGPMIEVHKILKKDHAIQAQLTLSDLYPNLEAAAEIKAAKKPDITYKREPVDATNLRRDHDGLRTMICSLHHMKPDVAKEILKNARDAHQPICIYEISDNSAPIFIWWIAIPISFIMVFLFTPMVRPMSWQQLVFTYLIPILPIFIAWDGAVSNARTYTLEDMDTLLEGLESENYIWEKNAIKGKGGPKLYLLGLPR